MSTMAFVQCISSLRIQSCYVSSQPSCPRLPAIARPTSKSRRPPSRRHIPQCTLTPNDNPLPKSFGDIHRQATDAALAAVTAGEMLVEVAFPPVPNMATAALNELLDANRDYAKQFLFACRPRFARNTLHAIFQEPSEARLAAKIYGPDMPFEISSLPMDQKSIPQYVQSQAGGLVVVISPGFNVDEWIAIERLQGTLPIVTINADLDKVRTSYYPRLFYPRLHEAKTRFLQYFFEAYYLKTFANGGTLYRCFPDQWRLFYTHRDGTVIQIWTSPHRPEFKDVVSMLAQRRQEDMLS